MTSVSAFTESDGPVGGAIHYNTDLFKPETIELMALSLKKLISGVWAGGMDGLDLS